MKSGIELINEERQEQIHKHGFSLEKDREYYQNGELKQAAKYCLMLAEFGHYEGKNVFWPSGWDKSYEHKIINKTKVGKLIVAGALFMAEGERVGDKKAYELLIKDIAEEIDRNQSTGQEDKIGEGVMKELLQMLLDDDIRITEKEFYLGMMPVDIETVINAFLDLKKQKL